LEVSREQIESIKSHGVQVKESAKLDAIDTFWRDKLAKIRLVDARLLVYWSGHGYTDNDGTRVLICRDYTDPNLNNRVFNASNFLRHLRGRTFQCFRKQLFVADVCASYTALNFAADQSQPERPDNTIEQVTYFAQPEGEYAHDNGRGVFTNIVMTVLRKFDCWPEFKAFGECMDKEFRTVGETPFRIAISSDLTHEAVERRVGSIPTNNRRPLFKSALSLLSPLQLPDSVYRQHYLRTVSNLGEPKLTQAQGLFGMIEELTSMRDNESQEGIPFGLMQFLVRLCQEEGVAQTIEPWLEEHAANQGNNRSNVNEIIEAESAEKLLIIEVINDDEGRIVEFQPYLRTQHLRVMEDPRLIRRKVKDWTEFESKVVALIKSLRSPPLLSGFQVHFLVDPPLFDKAFHMISASGGTTLGEEYVVLLRNRERIRFAPAFVRNNWKNYADTLRRTALGDLKLIPIQPPAPGMTLPDEKGLCYANFMLQSTSGAGISNEKLLMGKLMRKGVPYMYWLHSEPSGGALAKVGEVLTAWLKELRTLDEFPETFTSQRNDNDFALHASLLWDDPQFNPFPMTAGADVK